MDRRNISVLAFSFLLVAAPGCGGIDDESEEGDRSTTGYKKVGSQCGGTKGNCDPIVATCFKEDKLDDVGICKAFSIQIRSKSPYGKYLTDSNGMTLYGCWPEKDDKVNSDCSKYINEFTPLEWDSSDSFPAALTASDFGSISRTKGKYQMTYNGWPLYRYTEDKVAGDTYGQRMHDGLWLMATP